MSKSKSIYTCTECGGESPRWQGQCPHCGEWNTLQESIAEGAEERHLSVLSVSASRRSSGICQSYLIQPLFRALMTASLFE